MNTAKRKPGTIIIIIAVLSFAVLLCSCGTGADQSDEYHADSIADYDKSVIIEKYHGDLDSDLSVFPDELLTDDAEYSADFDSNLFDTDGRMILECKYSEEVFAEEIERLRGLSKTIEFEGQQYTNNILYDESSYAYPAYITIDGFGNTYEYALIDHDANRIIYIYLAYPGDETLKQYSDYVKKDLSAYKEENTMDAFSMYNHSFDDGETWIEFDD